jgi:HEAT repeat protein
LIADLDTPDPLVRQASAQALGRFGPAARDAVPALQGLLKDSDADVRQAATEALLNVAPPAGR